MTSLNLRGCWRWIPESRSCRNPSYSRDLVCYGSIRTWPYLYLSFSYLCSAVWFHCLLVRAKLPHGKQKVPAPHWAIIPGKYSAWPALVTYLSLDERVWVVVRVVVVGRFYDCTRLGEEPTAEDRVPKGGRILLPEDADRMSIFGRWKCHNYSPICDMP